MTMRLKRALAIGLVILVSNWSETTLLHPSLFVYGFDVVMSVVSTAFVYWID